MGKVLWDTLYDMESKDIQNNLNFQNLFLPWLCREYDPHVTINFTSLGPGLFSYRVETNVNAPKQVCFIKLTYNFL